MGTLVFQATLGGQVNLTGPNTASTFTISVPAITGTIITSGDTATVTSTMISGPITTAKGGTGLTSFTSGGAVYATSTSALATGTLPSTAGGTGLTSFTANGVVYASSSSALATGSALTFNGSNTFTVIPATGTAYNRTESTQYSTFAQHFAASGNTGVEYKTAYRFVDTDVGELMRLNSTGLGIGTSSPSTKLHVKGAVVSNFGVLTVQDSGGSGTSAYPVIALYDSALTHQGDLGMFAGDQVIANLTSTGKILFKTNSTTVGTIDTAGNLGLGVTPSAWGAGFKAFQIGARGSAYSGSDSSMRLAYNAYYDGTGYKRIAASSASQWIADTDGSFGWFQAGSSTAGSAITFTQAMTLDASGNLAVQNTNSGGWLYGGISAGTGSADAGFTAYSGSTNYCAVAFARGTSGTSRYSGLIRYYHSDDSMQFYTASTERARIDSSGNLLVGTTSAIDSGSITNNFNGNTVKGLVLNDNAPANTHCYIAFDKTSGTQIGTITNNSNTGVLYNVTSDYRLKTVISSVSGSGERIDALEPVEYEWKETGLHTRGFLAHKFQEVYANSVTGTKDAVDADGNPIYQQMQAATSEVIADLVAEIQSLRKRLADAGIA